MLVPNSRSCPKIQTVIGVHAEGERDDQVVPRPEELEDRERGDRRQPERQDQPHEDHELARPVDPGRLEDVLGDPGEEVSQAGRSRTGSPKAVWKRTIPQTVP